MTPFAQKIVLVLTLIVLMVLGYLGYTKYEVSVGVTSYDECAAAGYPILESYPQQCKTPDGRTFVATIPVATSTQVSEWLTFTNQTQGVAFQYPADTGTRYITAFNWPPKVTLTNGPLTCTSTGTKVGPNGKTEKKTIGTREYCVTTNSGGAAGSIYFDYTYATLVNARVATLAFTLQYPQCENFDDPQKSECKKDQSALIVDTFADKIIATVQLSTPVASIKSGITGTVTLGPTCPHVSNPPDPKCADKVYKTNLVVTTGAKAQLIKEFSSDASGKFTVDVPPGEYSIASVSSGVFPRCSVSGTIKVVANMYTVADVSCDTGIR